MEIDATERADFLAVLKERGFEESDFELSAVEHPRASEGIVPVRGDVTVRSIRSGVTRSYQCGHGTAWVVEFDRHLGAGLYDRP